MNIKSLKSNSNKGIAYLAGINRVVKPNQVTKLAESIRRMGLVRPVVVATISFLTGAPVDYIIDGQHLYNALLQLKMDIPYLYIEVKNKRDMVEKLALLNASSKSWCLADFILAWSSLEEDYVKLTRYFHIYDMEISCIASILSGKTGYSGGHSSNAIKRGEFKIVNEAEAVKTLDRITDMLTIAPRMGRVENAFCINEYIKFLNNNKNYNHKTFLINLAKQKDKLILATHEEGKLIELFRKCS